MYWLIKQRTTNCRFRRYKMIDNSTSEFRTASDELPKEDSSVLAHTSPSTPRDGIYDVLVLNAASRQSLVAVRSFGRRGLRVAAIETRDAVPAPAFSSRWCHYKMVCPAPDGTKEYVIALQQLL